MVRTLDALVRLSKASGSTGIVLCGFEADVDAADILLPDRVALGCPAPQLTDLGPLAGRDVLLWPSPIIGDDASHWVTACEDALYQVGAHVSWFHVRRGERASDMLEAGWDAERLADWAKERFATLQRARPTPVTPAPPPPANGEKPTLTLTQGGAEPAPRSRPKAAHADREGFEIWEMLGLTTNDRGIPHVNLDNLVRIFLKHDDVQGKVWMDTFHRKPFILMPHERPRPLTDNDVRELTVWVQSKVGLYSAGLEMVRQAVYTAAGRIERSEPKEWMEQLDWDRTPRLGRLMQTHFRSDHNTYTAAVGPNFFRSMVSRVYYEKGVHPKIRGKVDNMLILQGAEDRNKSLSLMAIGGDWYADLNESVLDKDFYVALQGKLLIEISELQSFKGARAEAVKAAVSRQEDTYRVPYGREAEDHVRRAVLAGTTNEDQPLPSFTGLRRFWFIKCGKIDLDGLLRDREQLFAEAVHDYKRGLSWWEMPDEETKAMQEQFRQRDTWEELIRRFITHERRESGPNESFDWFPRATPVTRLTVNDLLSSAMGLPFGRWDRSAQMRVSGILKTMGWVRHHEGEKWIYCAPGTEPEHPRAVKAAEAIQTELATSREPGED